MPRSSLISEDRFVELLHMQSECAKKESSFLISGLDRSNLSRFGKRLINCHQSACLL